MLPKKNFWVGRVVSRLVVLILQLALSVRHNSIKWDGDDHIHAGYMSWKHADFGLNPEYLRWSSCWLLFPC